MAEALDSGSLDFSATNVTNIIALALADQSSNVSRATVVAASSSVATMASIVESSSDADIITEVAKVTCHPD